jgi:hypothetical protein
MRARAAAPGERESITASGSAWAREDLCVEQKPTLTPALSPSETPSEGEGVVTVPSPPPGERDRVKGGQDATGTFVK